LVNSDDALLVEDWLDVTVHQGTNDWRVVVDVVPEVLRDVLEVQLARPGVTVSRGNSSDDGEYDVRITSARPPRSGPDTVLEIRVAGTDEDAPVVVEVADVATLRGIVDRLCPPRIVR
jgi:hypothetical protein